MKVGQRVEVRHNGKQVFGTVTGVKFYGMLDVRIDGEELDREYHLSTVAQAYGVRSPMGTMNRKG